MKRSLVIWAFLATILAALPAAHAQSAAHWYKQGQTAEAKDDMQAAYEAYYQAYLKKPTEERYKLSWERTRFPAAAMHVEHGEKLRDDGNYTAALTEFLRAVEIDPSNELASQDIKATRDKMNSQTPAPESAPRTTDEALELAPPIQLKPISSDALTLHMVEDSRVVYQAIGKMAGINVLFDPAYSSKRIQVDLNNVTLADGLRIVATVSNTFWRPITSNTIFVAENSRSKHTELDQQAVETFYLHNISQQNDFTEIQTVLRNLFSQGARINGVASENAIVMRATPDELLLAHKLIDDLDKAKPEVVIDVAVLEVSRDLLRNIGIQLPQTASINFQPSNANLNSTGTSTTNTDGTTTPAASTTTSSITLNNLAHLNSTNFAVTIGQAAVDLLLTDTRSRIIQNPQIRATDGQEATLKIGERIPIATGSYQTGAATAIVSSLVNTQFQYIDVGVNMDMKPTVHYDRDVSMKFKIEVSATNGNSNIGGITEPIITQRVIDQTIRLKDGEPNLLGGIVQHQTTYAISGTPGLAELPLLKYFFSTQQKEVTDDEIVFLVVPHVVRAQEIDPDNIQQIDTGTTNNIELRPMNLSQVVPQVTPPQIARNAAPSFSTPQTVPGVPQNTAAPGAAQAAQQAITNMQQQENAPAPVNLTLSPPQSTQKAGSTFKMLVDLSGGTDVFGVPLNLQYDASKLTLINVDSDDPQNPNVLGKDGQSVALVHRDDGKGNVAVAVSRPPQTKGISGASGTLCVLTFQANAAGDASVAITRPVVRNSQQQPMPATGSQAIVHIQ
ncbi:MAG TPA: cohesin domain-containing protein [Acidobacteriaceae bacterium]|jgi:general secretion pathway protein D|nr:cohesin domain-containing protein [Acidobacteriaceae bacterium]